MESFGIIYKATNNVNGKIYIGQTIQSLKNRIDRHLQENRTHFSRSLKKYGIYTFRWDILENCTNKDELNEMEYHYIMQYDTYKNGYNMTLGGEGSCGFYHSKETKLLLSELKKGTSRSEETKRNISESTLGEKNHFYGKHHTEYTKKIQSELKSGKLLSEEHKNNIGNAQRGIKKEPFTEEHKRNMSLSKIGKKRNKEHCAEQSQRMKADKNPNAKEYTIIYPNGESIMIKSLKTFAEANNLPYKTMIRLSDGYGTRKECLLGYKVIRIIE